MTGEISGSIGGKIYIGGNILGFEAEAGVKASATLSYQVHPPKKSITLSLKGGPYAWVKVLFGSKVEWSKDFSAGIEIEW